MSQLSQQNRDKCERLDNEDYSSADNFLKKVSLLRVDVETQFDDIKRVLEERREQIIRKLDILHKDTLRLIQKGQRRREHVRDLIEKSRAYEHLPMDGNVLINLDFINCKVAELLGEPLSRSKYRDIEFVMNQDVKCLEKRMIVYDPDLTTVWTVGRRSTGRGEYSNQFGIACLNDGTVYVCDKGNQKILVYERNSLFLGCN